MKELRDGCLKFFKTDNFYEAFAISKTATSKEITKAYKKKALAYHPDKNVGKEIEASDKFKLIGSIYSILSDENQKNIYDEMLKHGNDARFNYNDDWFKDDDAPTEEFSKDELMSALDAFINGGNQADYLRYEYQEAAKWFKDILSRPDRYDDKDLSKHLLAISRSPELSKWWSELSKTCNFPDGYEIHDIPLKTSRWSGLTANIDALKHYLGADFVSTLPQGGKGSCTKLRVSEVNASYDRTKDNLTAYLLQHPHLTEDDREEMIFSNRIIDLITIANRCAYREAISPYAKDSNDPMIDAYYSKIDANTKYSLEDQVKVNAEAQETIQSIKTIKTLRNKLRESFVTQHYQTGLLIDTLSLFQLQQMDEINQFYTNVLSDVDPSYKDEPVVLSLVKGEIERRGTVFMKDEGMINVTKLAIQHYLTLRDSPFIAHFRPPLDIKQLGRYQLELAYEKHQCCAEALKKRQDALPIIQSTMEALPDFLPRHDIAMRIEANIRRNDIILKRIQQHHTNTADKTALESKTITGDELGELLFKKYQTKSWFGYLNPYHKSKEIQALYKLASEKKKSGLSIKQEEIEVTLSNLNVARCQLFKQALQSSQPSKDKTSKKQPGTDTFLIDLAKSFKP